MRFPLIPRRLRWKLTLSYTLVTAAAILLVEIILLAVAMFMLTHRNSLDDFLIPLLQDSTGAMAPALEQDPPDTAYIQHWLSQLVYQGRLQSSHDDTIQINLQPALLAWAVVLDKQGQVITSEPLEFCPPDQPAASCLPPEIMPGVTRALANSQEDPATLRHGEQHLTAIPILNSQHEPVGVLVLAITWPSSLGQWVKMILQPLLPSALVVILFTSVLGAIFGYLTARGLTRRLTTLSAAADAWGQGDFSVIVQDDSQDEIGLLTQRLNRMAEQLQNLLQLREELATLEERNRLARDLHDSVKQQIFSAGMQLAAAQHHLQTDPAQAETALSEAQKLVHQAQQELTALIRELRPTALADQGLAAALRDLARNWSRQTGIPLELQIQDPPPLSLAQEQALFRVAQEALANVARHSQAQHARLTLQRHEDGALLIIEDDGRGFSPAEIENKGMGLRNMQERMAALGGDLHIETAPGQGVSVRAYLPLNKA